MNFYDLDNKSFKDGLSLWTEFPQGKKWCGMVDFKLLTVVMHKHAEDMDNIWQDLTNEVHANTVLPNFSRLIYLLLFSPLYIEHLQNKVDFSYRENNATK